MNKVLEISSALSSHPARIIKPGNRAHAAVALILEERPDGLNILFIERAANENDFWSGQIALPGGRTESCDSSPRQTAERETLEEIGLDLSAARYLGRINDIAPGSLQIVVSCFVYAVRRPPVLHPDEQEIADVFWVPVRELNNPARRLYVEIPVRGVLRRFPAVKLTDDNKRPLWGLTYRLVRSLNKVMQSTTAPGSSGPPPDDITKPN